MGELAQPRRFGLREPLTLRGEQDHRFRRPAAASNLLDRLHQRLGLHHHARPAAIRHIVHAAMPVRRVVAKVVDLHVEYAVRDPPANDPFRERGFDHPRKDGDDVELHSIPAIPPGD